MEVILLKINFFGDINSVTGYGVHGKNLFEAISKKGIDIVQGDLIGVPCLAITMPEQWSLRSGNRHKPFIPFLVFEGSKMSAGWVHQCNQDYISELLVPSLHVKEVAEFSGVKKDITIASHGVNPENFNLNVKREGRIPDDGVFRFLMLGGWGQGIIDRKGFQYALKAFADEFRKYEKVELYWRINMVYNPGLNIIDEVKKLNLPKDRCEIKILHNELSIEELAGLYKACDCFIAPSMAEAFGIPCAEAMACGLPVITTNYSGMLDYVDGKTGWLIDVERMIPSQGLPSHIYENALWAEPSVKHLKELMRYAYEHKNECVKKGILGSKRIMNNFIWDKTADIVIKRFKNY
jgi:glycosyltransferase involved in cell wall biosynthesis